MINRAVVTGVLGVAFATLAFGNFQTKVVKCFVSSIIFPCFCHSATPVSKSYLQLWSIRFISMIFHSEIRNLRLKNLIYNIINSALLNSLKNVTWKGNFHLKTKFINSMLGAVRILPKDKGVLMWVVRFCLVKSFFFHKISTRVVGWWQKDLTKTLRNILTNPRKSDVQAIIVQNWCVQLRPF